MRGARSAVSFFLRTKSVGGPALCARTPLIPTPTSADDAVLPLLLLASTVAWGMSRKWDVAPAEGGLEPLVALRLTSRHSLSAVSCAHRPVGDGQGGREGGVTAQQCRSVACYKTALYHSILNQILCNHDGMCHSVTVLPCFYLQSRFDAPLRRPSRYGYPSWRIKETAFRTATVQYV